MASRLKLTDKQEWAQQLITQQGFTQKEAAEKVGVTPPTMNKWYKKFNWEKLKQSMLITRQEQLNRLYMQIDELTTMIMNRETGSRFADSKEADTISKLTTAIERLETEANITDIVEVCKRLLNWMRKYNHPETITVGNIFNDFIKDNLKR